MTKQIAPALSPEEWVEWRAYKARLSMTSTDPARSAHTALQTMARNNDLLPDDSPYKVTHATIHDLQVAADCLESDGNGQQADSIRNIVVMLAASLGPG